MCSSAPVQHIPTLPILSFNARKQAIMPCWNSYSMPNSPCMPMMMPSSVKPFEYVSKMCRLALVYAQHATLGLAPRIDLNVSLAESKITAP